MINIIPPILDPDLQPASVPVLDIIYNFCGMLALLPIIFFTIVYIISKVRGKSAKREKWIIGSTVLLGIILSTFVGSFVGFAQGVGSNTDYLSKNIKIIISLIVIIMNLVDIYILIKFIKNKEVKKKCQE